MASNGSSSLLQEEESAVAMMKNGWTSIVEN